ncbi:MAG: hypothetical protein M3P51_06680 [Chloroflexota bacterium]|nr:hypothetical protein [Chloroflexota bacterium]
MIAYGQTSPTSDWLFSLSAPSLHDLRLDPWSLPSPHFACLLACDAHDMDDEVIVATANQLFDRGLAYFCAWGPDCQRVHDLVDDVILLRELDHPNYPEGDDERYPVMTTWHSEETLDEALWYLLFAARPDEVYEATCKSRLAISVGNDEWGAEIEMRFRSAIDMRT